jgi:hypothetical protein
MKDEKEKWELIDEIGKILTYIISDGTHLDPNTIGAVLKAKDKINKLKSLIIKEVVNS